MRRPTLWLLLPALLAIWAAACTPQAKPTPTSVAIVRQLATVVISPTPNPEQLAATRQAVSPTPPPPTATVEPSPTPYVGVFLGRAEPEPGVAPINEPIFGPRDTGGQPTAAADRCEVPIDRAYLNAWQRNRRVNERLGCPIQVAFGFFGEVQVFENGVMYRRPETREVWAVVTDREGGRYFYVEAPDPVSTVGIEAPAPLLLPEGDFASVWLSVQGLRSSLGYAQIEAQEVAMGLQRFDGGSFLLDASAGQVFALIVDGTAYGPFLAPQEGGQTGIGPAPEVTLPPEPPSPEDLGPAAPDEPDPSDDLESGS